MSEKQSKDQLNSYYEKCLTKQYKLGIENLKVAIQKGALKYKAFALLGHCYYLKEDFLSSRYFYELSLGETKTTSHFKASIYNSLGLLNIQSLNYAQAEAFFNKSIKIVKNYPPGLFNDALLKLLLGHYAQVIDSLYKIPKKFRTLYWSKLVLYTLILDGKHSKFTNIYSKLTRIDDEAQLLKSVNDFNSKAKGNLYNQVKSLTIHWPLFKELQKTYLNALRKAMDEQKAKTI